MKSLKNFVKGIAISVSTLVPGVSGGTMAIILGVYDELIHAIGSFFEDWRRHSVLLIQLGLGGLLGVIAFSRIVEYGLTTYPVTMGFFFIGVVAGGVPVLYKRATYGIWGRPKYGFLAIGLVVAIVMSGEPAGTTNLVTGESIASFIFLFIAGIVTAVALILPGISGSFMLLMLGLYDVTLHAINTFNIPFIAAMGIGVLVGTVVTTKFIEKMLQQYPDKLYMLILGFVLGSVIEIFPGIPAGTELLTSLTAMVLGFVLIFMMGRREA